MQGADVVIHEAQYTPEEYPSKRHWGHSSYSYAVELAVASNVGRLFLTHHDPSHDDEFIADMERKAQQLARSLGSESRSLLRLRRLRDHAVAASKFDVQFGQRVAAIGIDVRQ